MNVQGLGLAPFLAAHAVTSLAMGLAISVLACALLKLMARHSSAARFVVLYSALLAIVAAFFLRQTTSQSSPFYSSHVATLTLSARWALGLFYIWSAIALAGLTRIASGLLRLRKLRRSFIPLDLPELRSVFEDRHVARKRKVHLYHSSAIRVPAAIGFFNPAVVLSSWSLDELSSEELKTAVLHELAHVDRWDDWTNLGQKLIRALFFFHPAVWWIDSRLGIEREMSCDDAVLAQSASPQNYAQCLVSLAEKSFMRRQLALAHAAVGHMKQTTARIGRILDGRSRKPAPVWKSALAATAIFAGLGIATVQHLPQLVVLQGPPNAGTLSQSNRLLAAANTSHQQPVATQAVFHKPTPASRSRRTVMTPSANDISSPQLARNSGRPAVVVNAANRHTPSEFMYVVMQTRDYDSSGMVKVTTSVWRVRLTTLVPTRAESATPPHST